MSVPLNAFTVDLEDWFHVCGVGGALGADHWDQLPSRVELTTHILLDALARADVRATFFVVGWIAERHPRLIEAVRDAGHEIGSHGYRHERVYDLGPEEFARDLHQSVQALRAIGVPRVTLFRAPEWSINDRSLWALDQLARDGFTLDSSMAPLKIVGSLAYPRHAHLRHTTAGAVVEAPPLVADRFGQTMPMGWGWGLRMSSPDRILRTIEASNCSRIQRRAHGASMGARSRSAADAPAGRAAFRALLPAERFRRAPPRSSGSRQLRSHRAPRSFIAMTHAAVRSAISGLLLLSAIAANTLPAAAAQADNPAPACSHHAGRRCGVERDSRARRRGTASVPRRRSHCDGVGGGRRGARRAPRSLQQTTRANLVVAAGARCGRQCRTVAPVFTAAPGPARSRARDSGADDRRTTRGRRSVRRENCIDGSARAPRGDSRGARRA